MKKLIALASGVGSLAVTGVAMASNSAASQMFAAVPTSDITNGQITALVAVAAIPLGFAAYRVVRHVLGLVR